MKPLLHIVGIKQRSYYKMCCFGLVMLCVANGPEVLTFEIHRVFDAIWYI